MHAGRHVQGHVRRKERRAGSRHAEKRYASQILSQELPAAANGTGHYQATGSVAEKAAASERAVKDIQEKADFNIERMHEIEKVTNHDVISFLTSVAEYVGDASKYIHKGLTSSDVNDTALGVQMKHSAEILIDLEKKRGISAGFLLFRDKL